MKMPLMLSGAFFNVHSVMAGLEMDDLLKKYTEYMRLNEFRSDFCLAPEWE